MESRHAPLGGSEKQSQTANSPALRVMWLTFALGAQFANPCIWAQAPQVKANPGQAEAAPLRGAARTLDAPTIKAYPVESGDLTALQDRLREQYRGRSEVRISADSRTKQLLVVAPEAEQAAISQWLAAGAPLATGANAGGRTLQNISWRQLENGLRRAGAVPTASSATAAEVQYRVTVGPGEQADLFVNRDTGGLRFVGTANGEAVLQRLVDLLDRSPRGPEETSQLVSFTKAEPAKVHRVLTEIQAARRPTHPLAARPEHIGEMLTMVFQEGGQAAPAAPPAVAPPAAGNAPGGEGSLSVEEALGKILGNVQIEFVEGLDLLLVRGKQKDVERVLKIIEEIERQSVSTRPEVEVYFLKHVDGESLNLLIQSVYTQVFTARQGTVSITPLVKPNALLMIGRKENLEPIKQLIAKLDQPVDPETQLKVFRLKSLPAVDAESKLRNFFTATPGQGITPRTGLGVRVKIIADFRSNSLIVQASPRDLEEIGKLLDQIDADESSVVNEVRVIRLQNTLAEELAPILVETLTGIRQAGAGGQGQQGGPQQQQQQPGGGAGGQGGNTQASSSLKAISLQFLQSNGQGSELIKSGILADVRINADGRSNSVILNAPPKSMDLLEALIRQLDSLPATEAQIKVFTIVNGDATTLSTMLRELFGQQQNQQGGNQFNQNATGSGDNTLVPLRFSVDTRTNSIIASGSTGDLQVVYKILVRLDEGDIRERVTTVYRLRYAPALDVATALTNLLTNQRQVNQLAPNLQSAFEQLDREVIVVPEAVSNSLLVSATPRYYEEMKKTIEDLDRRPPMVVIQVLLAEVTLGDIDQFGVELGLQDSLLFNRSLLPAGGLASPGFNFNNQPLGNAASAASLATRNNVASQGLSNFAVGRTDTNLGYGGLVLSASSESVSVLIRALQQSSRIQVLSRPQVQTLDNQPAFVQVGQQVPRVTSVNFTNSGTSNGTELKDTGVILGVTPRTSSDGTIVMEIDAVKSAVGPIDQGFRFRRTTTATWCGARFLISPARKPQ
jgi:general secretion pathway protein D